MTSNDTDTEQYCRVFPEEREHADIDLIQAIVCSDLPLDYEFDGRRYCVLHYPSRDKRLNSDFWQVVHNRLRNKKVYLSGTYFPSPFFRFKELINEQEALDFSHCTFAADAQLAETTFNGEVKFDHATFEGIANFKASIFRRGVSFENATFLKTARFFSCEFNEMTDFSNSHFSGKVIFNRSRFNGPTMFVNTKFMDYCYFNSSIVGADAIVSIRKCSFESFIFFQSVFIRGSVQVTGSREFNMLSTEKNWLHLNFSKIEKGDALTFIDVALRPCWFLSVDCSNIGFHRIKWTNASGTFNDTENELKAVSARNIYDPVDCHEILGAAARELATNYESRNRFEQASKFRRMAFETEWFKKASNFPQKLRSELDTGTNGFIIGQNILIRCADVSLHALYRLTSFYGESWKHAAMVLFFLIMFFSAFYFSPFAHFSDGRAGLGLVEAFTYSLRTSILQRTEPLPTGNLTPLLHTIQLITTPLQLGLLALAVRRQFTR